MCGTRVLDRQHSTNTTGVDERYLLDMLTVQTVQGSQISFEINNISIVHMGLWRVASHNSTSFNYYWYLKE